MGSQGELKGKVAVVTGAASGIGLGLAMRAAKAGMKVALADIEEKALDTAVNQVRATGAKAIGVKVDVSIAEDVMALAARTEADLGAPWLVCNNAGVCKFGLSWKLTPADWKWIVDVNLWGVINGLHAFLPGLIERNAGHVVNVASAAAMFGIPGAAPYVATKHAVMGLSESLYRELDAVDSKVGVTVVCPALVNTNIMTATRNQPGRPPQTVPASLEPPVTDVPMNVLQPEELVDQILEAVVTRRFWLLPHAAQMREAMIIRNQQALDGINPDQSGIDRVSILLSGWQADVSFVKG